MFFLDFSSSSSAARLCVLLGRVALQEEWVEGKLVLDDLKGRFCRLWGKGGWEIQRRKNKGEQIGAPPLV
jgi:hypothetical protein